MLTADTSKHAGKYSRTWL